MPFPSSAAVVLAVCLQTPAEDRARAEQLARAGRAADAIALFEKVLEQDPRDDEARVWLARLALRLGRTAAAEDGFRTVLARRPGDIDARIGLAGALLRNGDWRGALDELEPLEAVAAANADLLATLARAYRRAGDDQRAMQYCARARARAPDDPDVVDGYEAVARVYEHAVLFEGWGQGGSPGLDARSAALTVDVRMAPRVRVQVYGRTQDRPDTEDAVGGAGVFLRAARATTVALHVLGGPGNKALSERHVAGEVVHYAGRSELGVDLRALDFADSRTFALSPIFAWDADRWRLDTRYTFSHSAFDGTADDPRHTSGDHSVFVRGTIRPWRRWALKATYAYGIESFLDLTSIRLRSLNASSTTAGVEVGLPSLSRIAANWERQWRSNGTSVDRLTLTLVQVLR